MKEFIKSIRDTLGSLSRRFGLASLPLFFTALVFLDYAFRWVYAGAAGGTRLLSLKPMAFTGCWALLITCLIALLPRLGRRIAMGALGVFFAFLVVLHGVMYNVFGHFFSFADMNFAGDGAKFFSWTYFRLPKKMYFFVLVFLLMVAAAMVLAQKPKAAGRRLWIRRGCALALVPLCLLGLGFTHQRLMPEESYVMTWDASVDQDAVVYRSFTDTNRSMKLTGLYQYTARNFAVSFGIGTDARSAEELTEVFESRVLPAANEFSGSLRGKNLMLVMLESIDTWMARPEYMPNFCRLMDEGVEFTDFYTPLFLSAGTFNTEIITQTGLVPPAVGMPNSGYSTNAFPLSLANLFKGEGYRVNSFHPASPGIYSRGSIHENLGFEKYHSYTDMGMDDYQLDSQMLRDFDSMTAGDSFYTYIITYSGHGPYTEEMGNIAAPHLEKARRAVEESGVTSTPENMEEYTRAVAHAMETDQFIGGLMDRLEESGLLKDTALLFYADHYGKYMSDKEFIAQLKGVRAGTPELYHTPCVLVGAGLEPVKVDKTVCSLDVVPTIADLFGLDAPLNYYAGESVFSPGEGLVPFPNGGWYDGETYFTGGEGTQTGEDHRAAELIQRVETSMEAVRTDYFRSWGK